MNSRQRAAKGRQDFWKHGWTTHALMDRLIRAIGTGSTADKLVERKPIRTYIADRMEAEVERLAKSEEKQSAMSTNPISRGKHRIR